MEVIFLIVGLFVGFLLGWMAFRISSSKRNKSLTYQAELDSITSENKIKDEKLAFLNNELENYKSIVEEKNNAILNLNREISSKISDYKNLAERLVEQKNEINKLNEKFSVEFKNLANEILEEKSKKFTQQNKENIDGILKPLKDKLKDFEKKVEEVYDKEAQQRFSLKEEVKRLSELNQQISKEANNLTKALKGESKTQGNWGEVILESILEKSGLVRDREYFVQESFTNDKGRRLQPDVIVKYPGDRNIIIDSKVSLIAYEKIISSENDTENEAFIKEHLLSIRNHINELSSKNYQDIYQLNSLDFVMMFMPIEPAYLAAIRFDSELWNYAYERRVLLISPTNLIAALKMIVSMWRQEYQNKNAIKIAETAGSLYDSFTIMIEDLVKLGKQIDSASGLYKISMNRLVDGRGNLIKRVEDIKKLGAKAKKSLPDNLLDRAIDN